MKPKPFGGKYSPEQLEEIGVRYLLKGWYECNGPKTLGWVSKCGTVFNCYCRETGDFYSFTTKHVRLACLNNGL